MFDKKAQILQGNSEIDCLGLPLVRLSQQELSDGNPRSIIDAINLVLTKANQEEGLKRIVVPRIEGDKFTIGNLNSEVVVIVSPESTAEDIHNRMWWGHMIITPGLVGPQDIVREIKRMCCEWISELSSFEDHHIAKPLVAYARTAVEQFVESDDPTLNDLKNLAQTIENTLKELGKEFSGTKLEESFISLARQQDTDQKIEGAERLVREQQTRRAIESQIFLIEYAILGNLKLIGEPQANNQDAHSVPGEPILPRSSNLNGRRRSESPTMSVRQALEEYCQCLVEAAKLAEKDTWTQEGRHIVLSAVRDSKDRLALMAPIVSREYLPKLIAALENIAPDRPSQARHSPLEPLVDIVHRLHHLLLFPYQYLASALKVDYNADIKKIGVGNIDDIIRKCELHLWTTRKREQLIGIVRALGKAANPTTLRTLRQDFDFSPEGLAEALKLKGSLNDWPRTRALLTDMRARIVRAVGDGAISLDQAREFSRVYSAFATNIQSTNQVGAKVVRQMQKELYRLSESPFGLAFSIDILRQQLRPETRARIVSVLGVNTLMQIAEHASNKSPSDVQIRNHNKNVDEMYRAIRNLTGYHALVLGGMDSDFAKSLLELEGHLPAGSAEVDGASTRYKEMKL